MEMEYVLITAARNEEAYIENTLRAVCSQTRKPKLWIIVDDNSTDRTGELVEKYLVKNDFMRILHRKAGKERNFGSQVYAINAGYELVKEMEFDLIGNCDADISFEPGYYKALMERFQANPRLGLAGGWIQEKKGNLFSDRLSNSKNSVPHAVQLFRRECFSQIGGYTPLPYGGPDWYAEILARMNGWEVTPFHDLKVAHHKPTSSVEGITAAAWRAGNLAYSLGSHPLFEMAKSILYLVRYPHKLYPVVKYAGFIVCYLKGEKRVIPPGAVSYLRREQIFRLTGLRLRGYPQSTLF